MVETPREMRIYNQQEEGLDNENEDKEHIQAKDNDAETKATQSKPHELQHDYVLATNILLPSYCPELIKFPHMYDKIITLIHILIARN